MKIFITGISSGIGRQLAKKLVAAGHEVWGLARRKDLLDELKQEVGEKLVVSECDLASADQARAVATEFRSKGFMPDVVILNAGVHEKDLQGVLDQGKIKKNIDVNFTGAMFWVSKFLPEFLKKKSGIFIAIVSTSAFRPGIQSVSYSASKSALSMAFRGLRFNFGNSGVRFSTIYPGPVDTRLWPGKKSFLVASPKSAAEFIINVINRPSGSYFFPFLSTFLFRIIKVLPDKVFGFLGKILRR